MGRPKEINISDEDALHIGKTYMGWGHLSDTSIIHTIETMFNDAMWEQSNIRGVDWFRAFKYLESKGYDLAIYNKT